MKKKNIVQNNNKRTPIYKDKRLTLVAILILLMLAFSVMTMPMADIPFLGRMGNVFGLNDDSMRSLNFTDFAAYSLGAKDGGRLASVRSNQYSVYESAGGLSPFSLQAGNRMIDAKESYLAEFDRTGKWNNIRGSASGRDIEAPEGVSVPAYYGNKGIEAVAPAIDPESSKGYDDAYGKPLVKSFESDSIDSAYQASSLTEYDSNGNMVLKNSDKNRPFRSNYSGKMRSARSDEDNVYFQAIDSKVKALRLGRLGTMGGNGARTTRVGTSIGSSRQLNAFGFSGRDMGRVYYLSSQARGQKYNDVAKNVAEAAFDGGEVQAEDMLAVDEKTPHVLTSAEMSLIAGSASESSSAIIDKTNKKMEECLKAAISDEDIQTARENFVNAKSAFLSLNAPCMCSTDKTYTGAPEWRTVSCNAQRQNWDEKIDELKDYCEKIHQKIERVSAICGFNYDLYCERFEEMKTNRFANFWDEEPLVTVIDEESQLEKQVFQCVANNTTCCWDQYDSLKQNRYKNRSERENLIKEVSEQTGLNLDDIISNTFF